MNHKNSFSFRKAVLADSAAISRLVNSAYRGDISRQGWTTEADFLEGQRTDPSLISEMISEKDQFILLCEQNGEIIGSVHLERKSPELCYFGMFAIEPKLQAQGIGKAFIEEAERFAHSELGCSMMEMTVITIRKELIAWYERRGYMFTGELKKFPYGDERFGIPLRKDLQFGVWSKRL